MRMRERFRRVCGGAKKEKKLRPRKWLEEERDEGDMEFGCHVKGGQMKVTGGKRGLSIHEKKIRSRVVENVGKELWS
jgi:hypothetical protein